MLCYHGEEDRLYPIHVDYCFYDAKDLSNHIATQSILPRRTSRRHEFHVIVHDQNMHRAMKSSPGFNKLVLNARHFNVHMILWMERPPNGGLPPLVWTQLDMVVLLANNRFTEPYFRALMRTMSESDVFREAATMFFQYMRRNEGLVWVETLSVADCPVRILLTNNNQFRGAAAKTIWFET